MTQEELILYHESSFDAFCKKTIRNLSVDAKRIYWRKTEIQTDNERLAEYIQTQKTEDTYSISTYSKTYYVKEIVIIVKDEAIGEALQFIMPNKRAVLLLSYFLNYKDTEIARILKITHSTVSYRKKQALIQLREMLEGRMDA